MRNRFKDAYHIWMFGASNPRGVARSLVEAIDEAVEEGNGSAAVDGDAAVIMIIDHLSFMCGLPQPSLDMTADEWDAIMKTVEERMK